MLTVIREMAARGRRSTSRTWTASASSRSADGRGAGRSCWPRCSRWPLRPGEEAVERTPEQLDVLRRGRRRRRRGARPGRDHARDRRRAARRADALPEIPHHEPARHDAAAPRRQPRTATARTSSSPAAASTRASFVRRLEEIGDSVLVVGDEATLKVHVHTDEPEVAVARVRGGGRGAAARHRRHARAGRRARARAWRLARTGVVAVAAGDGHAGAVRGARRARRRRRPDAQPVDLGPARGDPRGARRGGARAAQLAERDPGRRGGGAAVREAGSRRRLAAPSRRRWRRWSSSTPSGRRGERRAARGRRSRRSARARSRRPRATTPQGRFVRGDAVGFAGDEVVAWGGAGSTLSATIERSPRAPRSSP